VPDSSYRPLTLMLDTEQRQSTEGIKESIQTAIQNITKTKVYRSCIIQDGCTNADVITDMIERLLLASFI